MQGTIGAIIQFKAKTKRINIQVEGVSAKTYVDDNNANSVRWEAISVGDKVSGLVWFDKAAKIIDADSLVQVV